MTRHFLPIHEIDTTQGLFEGTLPTCLPLAPNAPSAPQHSRRSCGVRALSSSDGARTTLYVATYDTSEWTARLALLSPPRTLARFCVQRGVSDALVGGFFTRASGIPLGELRTRGVERRLHRSPRRGAPAHLP